MSQMSNDGKCMKEGELMKWCCMKICSPSTVIVDEEEYFTFFSNAIGMVCVCLQIDFYLIVHCFV